MSTREVQCRLASRGQLEKLKELPSCVIHFHDDIIHNAIKHGHLHILQWEYEIGYKFCIGWARKAAEYGYIHILEYFRSIEIEPNDALYLDAAKGGRINVLKWLVSNGVERTGHIAYPGAIMGNRIDVVKWLLNNGFPATTADLEFACEWRRDEIAELLTKELQ